VRRIIAELGEHELAVPFEGEFPHPLAGVYRTSLAPRIRELLAAGRRRPLFLIEQSRARRIPVDSFRDIDPRLESLRNANTWDEYLALCRLAATTAGAQSTAGTTSPPAAQ
jgi:molybdopterin-guanine dinucleotide biosynthesis protein A